jgi:hypothetical protein
MQLAITIAWSAWALVLYACFVFPVLVSLHARLFRRADKKNESAKTVPVSMVRKAAVTGDEASVIPRIPLNI